MYRPRTAGGLFVQHGAGLGRHQVVNAKFAFGALIRT